MRPCRDCGEPVTGRASLTATRCFKCATDPARLESRRQRDKRSLYYILAHRYVEVAVRCGDLKKLDGTVACADCRSPAKVYDHRDYTKPLQVDPVCRRCNHKRGIGKNALERAA